MSTLDNFRTLGAAAARLFADALDGPEPCGHDYDRVVDDLGPFEHYCESATETSSAEGTRRSHTPGEVSGGPQSPDPSPSPGDLDQLADSELLTRAAETVDLAARRTPNVLEINDLLNLAEALRDRAAQFAAVEAEPFVAQEDLAAHITAIRHSWAGACMSVMQVSDEIARDLTSDYFITKK